MAGQDTPRGDFDVIVIGSGVGGLVAAAILAHCTGRRALVLERHHRMGGFTHTFSRPGGFHWDVGVHYVGREAVDPGVARDVLAVATGGALAWSPLPDPFERLSFPGLELSFRAGRDAFVEDLARAFPGQAGAVRGWLADIDRVIGLLPARVIGTALPRPVRWTIEAALAPRRRLAATRTADVLARHFSDPVLRAVVGARWGDYGLPPGQSAFLAHAVITHHYLDGAVYPAGSAARIGEAMARTLVAAGGQVRVGAEVERILVRGGRAAGVRLRGGEEILAPVVISDAGARNTWLRLVSEDVPVPFREALRRMPTGASDVTLFLGLSRSPASLGVRGENFWLHEELDQDALWASRHRLTEGVVRQAYLSFPSMKDPEARAHTAEIVAPAEAADFAPWAGTRWMKRGEDYRRLKERLADALLAQAERRLPGLSALVVHRELSTPLTTEHFAAHPGGAIYGVPWTPDRVRAGWLGARGPVKGLFTTGADALAPGVVGATMGGLSAAAAVAGLGLFRAVGRAAARLSVAPATAPTPAATSPSSA